MSYEPYDDIDPRDGYDEHAPDGAIHCWHCDKLYVPRDDDAGCPQCGAHPDEIYEAQQ